MKKSRGELVQRIISLLRDKQGYLHDDWIVSTSDSLSCWEESWHFQECERIGEEINQLWAEEYNNA